MMGRYRNPKQPNLPRFCLICEVEIPKIRLESWSSYNRRETCSRKHRGELASKRAKDRREGKTVKICKPDALMDALNRIARSA